MRVIRKQNVDKDGRTITVRCLTIDSPCRYVSLEEYPYRLWPPYPTAGSFFVPFETAERLYAAMPYIRYLRFDDVFVGIAAWKLKVSEKSSGFIRLWSV